MPEATYLHIQVRESGVIRVLEIPWISVRIGRARFCEVRLEEEDLPEQVCRLQRRGRLWHLIPFSSKALLFVQDEPVYAPCALPMNLPFRIGSVVLTLRQNQVANPSGKEFGREKNQSTGTTDTEYSFDRSERLVADFARMRTEIPAVEYFQVTRVAESSPTLVDRISHISMRTPGEPLENPWVGRWQAAADRLYKRNSYTAGENPVRPNTAFSASSRKTSYNQNRRAESTVEFSHSQGSPKPDYRVPYPLEYSTPSSCHSQNLSTLPTSNPVTSKRTAFLELAQDLDGPRQSAGLPKVRQQLANIPPRENGDIVATLEDPLQPGPLMHLSSAIHETVIAREAPVVSNEQDPPDPPSQALKPALCKTQDRVDSLLMHELVQETSTLYVTFHENQPISPLPDQPADSQTLTSHFSQYKATLSTSLVNFNQACFSGCDTNEIRTRLHAFDLAPQDTCDLSYDQPIERDVAFTLTHRTRAIKENFQRDTSYLSQLEELKGQRLKSKHSAGDSFESTLPLMKDILASAPLQLLQSPKEGKLHPSYYDPSPTVCQKPEMWSPNYWVSFGLCAVLLLGLGVTDSLLSVFWARDGFNASIITQRLLAQPGGTAKDRPLPESIHPGEPFWWHTTPLHLVQWAVYLGRSQLTVNRTNVSRKLLEEALRISPVNATARLARAQLMNDIRVPEDVLTQMGLSRDVVALTQSATQLRIAGNAKGAIKLYRQALELTVRSMSLMDLDVAFNDDPQSRRYYLPGEQASLMIIGELVSYPRSLYQEWSQAVPANSLAILATARVLHRQGNHETKELLEEIVRRITPSHVLKRERAIQHAICAEAYAMLAQWRKAEEQYELAINEVENSTLRRSWWYNLATIAFQVNDDNQLKTALQAILDSAGTDKIRHHALELQRATRVMGRLLHNSTKTN